MRSGLELRIEGALALLLAACAGCGDGAGGGSADADSDTDTDADSDTDVDSYTDVDSDTDADPDPSCEPLGPPDGNLIAVGPDQVGELQGIVAAAETGDVILLEDGTYPLDGAYLWFGTPGVTLRSESGDPEAVVIDGNYATTEIVTVAASDVTIAEVTLQRAYTHPIHVTSSELGDTVGTLIYRVRLIDPREQAIKINPHSDSGVYPDGGEIACSLMLLTDEGRPNVNPTSGGCYTGGVDAHQARDWIIRDNRIEGFWCGNGLSEHAIHLWNGCRDPIVERNVLVNNARGVGFGLVTSGDARTYDDDPCPEAGAAYVDHYGGVVRNNFVFADRAELFSSGAGYDCGICLWSACAARVFHNTLVSTEDHISSIEWRFAASQGIEIANNLATDSLWEREEASAELAGNLEGAATDLVADLGAGDLHLAADAAAAIDQGVSLEPGLCDDDIDGDPRDGAPDIGADEVIP